jgi:DNA-binding response OmpR family regulator
MTVLAVDDDRDDLDIFSECLSIINPNINCIALQDSKQALSYLSKESALPDITFLDINMPGLNGRELLRQIRSDPKLKDLYVVMISTSTSEKDISESRSLGAEYMVKPTRFDLFIKEMRQILERLS